MPTCQALRSFQIYRPELHHHPLGALETVSSLTKNIIVPFAPPKRQKTGWLAGRPTTTRQDFRAVALMMTRMVPSHALGRHQRDIFPTKDVHTEA
jgi:hypothetical protein